MQLVQPSTISFQLFFQHFRHSNRSGGQTRLKKNFTSRQALSSKKMPGEKNSLTPQRNIGHHAKSGAQHLTGKPYDDKSGITT
jgi:hypothetical protein